AVHRGCEQIGESCGKRRERVCTVGGSLCGNQGVSGVTTASDLRKRVSPGVDCRNFPGKTFRRVIHVTLWASRETCRQSNHTSHRGIVGPCRCPPSTARSGRSPFRRSPP